ncbi:MAG: undecaprenyl-phosphate glucose phosphotransferase [Xanthomonadaceae bacterium]|nr:undecaprenyl-phosphate glucose phosphotransferase [Xanthomonadaceae bacterium]
MLKRYQSIIGGLFRITDLLVISAAWLAAYFFRFYIPLIEVTKGFPPFSTYLSLLPLILFLWMIVFNSLRVYQPKRMLRRTDEALLLLKAHFFALMMFLTLTYLISEYRYSRVVMIYFGVLGGIGLVVFRLILRNAVRSIHSRGKLTRSILAVGEGKSLDELIYRLKRFPELGFELVGVVSGDYSKLSEVLKSQKIDQILIALPHHQSAQLEQVLAAIKDETIDIKLVPDLQAYIALGCEVEEFDGIPILNLNDSPLEGWWFMAKRITDILLSLIALVVLSPVLGLVALAVKLTSRGDILYSQERMGLDGRVFKMYKFRSMKVDAETQTGAVWAKENDDRRTSIGTILRSTSLDELPQFWNVFVGDMSLVGPRPERPVFVSQFRGEIPHYMLRHKVKAGITGWAQINGWRGNTSLERRIECDLYYIRNWSYLFDLKILFYTLWRGFIHKNAY